MALEKLTENVEIHQTMGDTPNTDGMTATDLKVKFDLAAKIIKQFINDKIIPHALDKRGDAMKGTLRMSGNRILEVPPPVEDKDATNKAYVDGEVAKRAPAVESKEYPGCYYRIVDGVTEWINPPMVAGVEYRTTERKNGNVVYAKMIDFGVLPNNSTKSVYIGVKYTDILSIDNIYYNSKVNASYTVEQSVVCAVYQNNINITTQSDMTHDSAKIIVKYTKD